MIFESVRLLAVISVAICLIPAGAHFFELVNKMSLSRAEYIYNAEDLCRLVLFRRGDYCRNCVHLDAHFDGSR